MHNRVLVALGLFAILSTENQVRADNIPEAIELQSKYMNALNAGQLQKALDLSNKAVEIAPNSEAMWNDNGVILSRMKRPDDALKSLDKAISIKTTPKDLAGRAAVYVVLKRYKDALADSNRAVQMDPLDPVAYNNRALAELHLGDAEKALEDLNKALKIKPDLEMALISRGKIELDKEELKQAKVDLDQAAALDPKDAGVYSTRAMVFWRLKDKDKAMADANKAYELSPTPVYKGSIDFMKTHPITAKIAGHRIEEEDSIDVRPR